jgi:hypothetical protein
MIVLISRGLMAVASMRELLAGCASNLSCHHPRKRVIQYAAASRLITSASGILGRPVKPGDDSSKCGTPLLQWLSFREAAG